MPSPPPPMPERGLWEDWFNSSAPPPAAPAQPDYPEALPAPTPAQQSYPPRFYEPRPGPPNRPVSPPPAQRPPYPYQPPASGPPPQPAEPGQRPGSPLGLLIVLLVVLVGGAAAVLLLARPFSHTVRDAAGPGPSATATRTSGASPGPSGSAGTSPSAPGSPGATSPGSSPPGSAAGRPAAAKVASMLSGSAADRTAILGAFQQVSGCGAQLAAAPRTFTDAARSRHSLIVRLAGLSGPAALPAALVSDLTRAWQASAAADQDYAKWANDEITQGCVANDTGDPAYQAADGPDAQSTQYKNAFVSEWNPIAAAYGLTQYQAGQL